MEAHQRAVDPNFFLPINLQERNLFLWQIWTKRSDVLDRIDQVFTGKIHQEPPQPDGLCIGHLEEIRVSAAFLFDDICRIKYRPVKIYAALTPDGSRGVISVLFVRNLRPDDNVIDLSLKKQPDEKLDRAVKLYKMLSPDIEGYNMVNPISPVPYSGIYSWDNGPNRPLTLIMNGADVLYPQSEILELRLGEAGIELKSAAVLKVTSDFGLELAWQYQGQGLTSQPIKLDEAMRMHQHVMRTYMH